MDNPIEDLPPPEASTAESRSEPTLREKHRRRRLHTCWALITLVAFIAGSAGGYFLGSQKHGSMGAAPGDAAALVKQINPPEGYPIEATFGDLGPRLLEAGAMELDAFIQVYEQAGQPLNEEQLAILQGSSPAQVVFNRENAYFLLNFFWALGLTDVNPVLTEGPMVRNGRENVVNYASTGGWSLAAKPVQALYASVELIQLTPEQQARLEAVAQGVYRPCCDNPTFFPDCNHGMAMLGLLELMASQDASEDEMFQAAKYANAYWYPQQTLEVATYFKVSEKAVFDRADARQLVSQRFSSRTGFQTVHQWLATNGLLQQAPGGGNSCGVQ
jgi:hypothetical protein